MVKKGVKKGNFRPLSDFLCIVHAKFIALYSAHTTRLDCEIEQSGTLFAVRAIWALQQGVKVDPFLSHAFFA